LNWYRVRLKLKSWFATPWQADTIFGHLCWGMRYLYDADCLRDFLNEYVSGRPPLLLSNGFPAGFLPHPLINRRSGEAALSLSAQKDEYEKRKQAKSRQYVLLQDFNEIIQGGLLEINGKYPYPILEKRTSLKNQLNRLTATTGENGNLFNFEEYYIPEIEIYLKCRDDFVYTTEELFDYLAQSGYGKRKSIGYGQIKSLSFESFSGFKAPESPAGFVTLSNFVPSENDPVRGNWQVMVKYGKMGEEYAAESHAFKHPLLMLEAGSVFLDSPVREYYGCMIKHVSPGYPEAVQYAFALPVPCVLPQNQSLD